MEVAQALLVADGYALWASDPEQGAWRVLESAGVSAAFAAREVASHQDAPVPGMPPFSEALCVSDVDAHPLLAGRSAQLPPNALAVLVASIAIDLRPPLRR